MNIRTEHRHRGRAVQILGQEHSRRRAEGRETFIKQKIQFLLILFLYDCFFRNSRLFISFKAKLYLLIPHYITIFILYFLSSCSLSFNVCVPLFRHICQSPLHRSYVQFVLVK